MNPMNPTLQPLPPSPAVNPLSPTTPKAKPPKRVSRPTSLRFTPYAWAKLLYLRDAGDTEIGGFGIAHADDLLLIEDIQTVNQRTTSVTVAFEDTAVADFFEDQVEHGRRPEQFARVWIHTHPGDSPNPSGTDEETFERVFGSCDWASMFILAKGGKTYCQLRFNVGPGGATTLPLEIDYGQEFNGSAIEAWQEEYDRNVHEKLMPQSFGSGVGLGMGLGMGRGEEYFGQPFGTRNRSRERMPESEEDLREMLLSEYAEYWGAEREVFE